MSSPIWHTRRTLLRSIALTAGAGLVTAACSTIPATPDDVAQLTEYRLGPGDQLRITVFNEAELTGQYIVGSQGTISYPLVGEVHAAGLTLAEFSAQLQTALAAYIRAPNVSVEVANYRPFFILGEVRQPPRRAGDDRGAEVGEPTLLQDPHVRMQAKFRPRPCPDKDLGQALIEHIGRLRHELHLVRMQVAKERFTHTLHRNLCRGKVREARPAGQGDPDLRTHSACTDVSDSV